MNKNFVSITAINEFFCIFVCFVLLVFPHSRGNNVCNSAARCMRS